MVDNDSREEEFLVEEIYGDRRWYDGGLELFVK